ncbi:plastidial lipoyltransferase 2-like [Gossypium australe]|uniref:Plastidial lipoyltransferase 2-like n=1 Tax=Gossypium australe TaxID=47621 RepID=A0A5B6X3N1_9ROSI|nr:plastidial lipoyltransferase 2-like [Gossypium australe]
MCPEFVLKRNCHFMQIRLFLAMKDAAQKCLRLYHKDMPQKIKGRFEIIIAAISLQFHPL